MKMNQFFKKILFGLLLIIGSAIVGICLLWAVYALPTESMASNVTASESVLKAQDDTDRFMSFQFADIYDTHTNVIILHEIIYPNSDHPFIDALLSPTINCWETIYETEQISTLIDFAKTRVYNGDNYETYARYWHGYLIFLKPLFMFFNLQEVYQLNTCVLLVLITCVFYVMRKKLGDYCWAYLFAILTMHPLTIIQSFQLSMIFYVLHIIMLILLFNNKNEQESLFYIFVLDGILVAFLDFLTYPLVAFAIPFITSFLLYKKDRFVDVIKFFFSNGFAFVYGYVGMWGMKWILASLFTNENVILDAFQSVLHRTGAIDDSGDSAFIQISAKDAVINNVNTFFNDTNKVIILVALILVVSYFIRMKENFHLHKNIVLLCIVIAILPLIWFVVLKNHCSLHPHLEWRTLSIMIYSLGILVMNFVIKEKIK